MENVKKKDGFLQQLITETVALFKNPKKLIPTFVLAGLWILLSLLSAFGVTNPLVRFMNVITFAGGGMYGGFIGTVGGIFAKALFAAFVTGIVRSIANKKNPLAGSAKGFKALFDSSVFSGLDAISEFVLFAGFGLLLNMFFNFTSNPANCAISIVCLWGTIMAAGSRHGLLFSFLFKLLGLFTKGKAPSLTSGQRAFSGMTAGFTLGFSLTFTRLSWLMALVGGLLVIGGIVCAVVGRIRKEKV